MGQNFSGHLLSVREEYLEMMGIKFKKEHVYETVSTSLFVNTDETAVSFEARPKSTVYVVRGNKIPVRCIGNTNSRVTVFVSVAFNGTKLPLLVIFKR